MNLGDLRDYVYEQMMGTARRGLWSEASMTTLINRAHIRVFQRIADRFANFFVTTGTITEVADQVDYNTPTDLYRLLLVERLGDDGNYYPMGMVSFNADAWELETGPLSRYIASRAYDFYYLKGQEVLAVVSGSPKALTNGLRLTYVYRPAEMKATDDEPFQQTAGKTAAGQPNLSEWHDLIALMVLPQAWMREGDESRAAFWAGERDRRIAELDEFLFAVSAQRSRYIQTTNEGYDL